MSNFKNDLDHSRAAPGPAGWPRGRQFEGAGWLTVEQGRDAYGLRITDSPYWAAWWAQILRGILHVKSLPYLKVVHPPYSEKDPASQDSLFAWTAQTSVPVLAYRADKDTGDHIRADWLGQLMLCEQLALTPSLIPAYGPDRVMMFGLAHEILSPQGLMWNARLLMAERMLRNANLTDRQRDFSGNSKFLGGKYDLNAKQSSPVDNICDCLVLLDEQLALSAQRGSVYFFGNRLSALDIYWAYASNIVSLLPHEALAIMRFNRAMYDGFEELFAVAVTPRLLEHRNRIFAEYLPFPVEVD